MTNESVLAALRARFPAEGTFTEAAEPHGLLTVTVPRAGFLDLMHFLKEGELGFTFLTTMCAVHYPDQAGREMALVYHLHNLFTNTRLRLKVFLAEGDIVMPTLTNIWAAANWMERETYDFYGVHFEGHPNLIRILNVEDMTYHPMRKEYPLEDQSREDKTDSFFGR